MPVEIREETPEAMADYATIPISFWVRSRLRADWIEGGMGGIRLWEQPVSPPYVKDYDAVGDAPPTWEQRWDMSHWGVFLAREDGVPVGGAVVAWRTPGLHMLEGRDDLAVLWDLRVKDQRRRCGLGRQLVSHAALWARDRRCPTLRVETQNNNVSACRFYAACGFRLCGVYPGAYSELPDEVMLLWHLDLK